MATYTLQTEPRTLTGRKTKALRDEAKVPAVVYGAGRTPENVTVDRVLFIKTFREAGTSGLVYLSVGSEQVPVLIHDYDQDPVSNFLSHIDFLAVDLAKEVEAELQLEFIGEAPAVKSLGGTLVTNVVKLSVTALPTALVSHFDVDISLLATFKDMIRVSDLKLPPGIKVDEEEMNLVVAYVSEPRSEEELSALNEAVVEDVATVETVEKKKDEEEEAEEGTQDEKKEGKEEKGKEEKKKEEKK